MPKVEIARMSWVEAKAAAQEKRTVLIPVGCLEQHGRHIPLGSDSMVADYYAIEVAKRSGAVTMPPINYGWSPFFRGFTGSISIKPATLEALLNDIVEGLMEQGFDHLIFVSNHASNEPMIEHVAQEVKRRTGLVTAMVFPWRMVQEFGADLHPKEAWGHGAEPETSVILALWPEDVDMSAAVEGKTRPFQGFEMSGYRKVKFNGFWAGMYVDTDDVSDSGAIGVPFGGDAEKGRIVLERCINWGTEFVKRFSEIQTKLGQA